MFFCLQSSVNAVGWSGQNVVCLQSSVNAVTVYLSHFPAETQPLFIIPDAVCLLNSYMSTVTPLERSSTKFVL